MLFDQFEILSCLPSCCEKARPCLKGRERGTPIYLITPQQTCLVKPRVVMTPPTECRFYTLLLFCLACAAVDLPSNTQLTDSPFGSFPDPAVWKPQKPCPAIWNNFCLNTSYFFGSLADLLASIEGLADPSCRFSNSTYRCSHITAEHRQTCA